MSVTMDNTAARHYAGKVRLSQRFHSISIAGLDGAAKRLFDFYCSLIALIILWPFFALIAILIKIDSPGPIFYRGRRVGSNGREFQIYKFRTMKECPESYRGSKVTPENDSRVTSIGRWLRDTKINELPQLWNVFKGDMSLVGPRPEDPEIVATWSDNVRREVLSVRPGITSPASVLYRNEEALLNHNNVMQTYLHSVLPSKLRLDQLYVRHRSLALDLDILLWTALVLLPRLKAFVPKEDTLFLGPISRLGRQYLNWFVVDTIVTFFAIGVAGILWRRTAPLELGWGHAVVIALGFAFLFSVVEVALGMNRVAWSQAWASEAIGLVVGAFLAACIALGANQFQRSAPLLPPGMLIFASILALTGFVAVRYRTRMISGFASRWLARSGSAFAARERVLIIGSGHTGQFVAWLLGAGNSLGVFHVVGFVDDDLYKQGIRYHGVSVIGRRADICRLVERHDVGIIVFAIHNIDEAERKQLLEICGDTPARVVVVPDIVGALNDVVFERAKREDDNASIHRGTAPTQVPLFTSGGIPPVQAQLWLADLERAVESGDLASVGEQIRLIREGILRFTA